MNSKKGGKKMSVCVAVPYTNFKDKISKLKQLDAECIRKAGNGKYEISDLDGLLMAEYIQYK